LTEGENRIISKSEIIEARKYFTAEYSFSRTIQPSYSKMNDSQGQQEKDRTRSVIARTIATRAGLVLVVILLSSTLVTSVIVKPTYQSTTTPTPRIPDLSFIATQSLFAKVANMGYTGPQVDDGHQDTDGTQTSNIQTVNSYRINSDQNKRPQDEPAVTLNPANGTVVVGANDYGIGGPVGGGVYTHFSKAAFPAPSYYPPFPLMCGGGTGSTCIYEAPPIGTGDPALAYSQRYNEYYYTSLGFTNDNCANGVFFFRSANGLDWTRPVINRFLATPTATGGGLRTVTYWDGGSSALDCSQFNDKEWVAVDNTPTSQWYGRIYVTWSQFHLDPTGLTYVSSPIVLAFSDDHGDTWSNPIDVTGSISPNPNCTGFALVAANSGNCVEDQFSVPVVGTDGSVYVAFINQQHETVEHRDQYLVTKVTPAPAASGFTERGAYLATFPVYDTLDDYPTQTTGGQGRATLCNSNFRLASTEGFAIKVDGTNAANDKLYIAWADDRVKAGQFTGVTVGPASSGYACPNGLMTDSDIFIVQSTSQGVTWTAPIQVNQDKPSGTVNNVDQFFPWVSVNSKGQVAVLYLDRRYDTTPVPNKLYRATVGTTTDLLSWKETLIAQFPSNADNGFRQGVFIGDYNNVLIANDGTVYAVWTGVTPGKFDSDIFIAIFKP
jgi:hypothetical protein